MSKQVWMPIGLAGIGKSTYLQGEFAAKQQPYRWISPDGIREELTGDASDLSRDDDVFALAQERLKTALRSSAPEDQAIVLDATFMHAKGRKRFIDHVAAAFAEGIPVSLRVLTFPVDVKLALARQKGRQRQVPPEAIARMAKNYQPFQAAEAQGVPLEQATVTADGQTIPTPPPALRFAAIA